MSTRKKEFPPGTFLPLPQRIVAILQLCVSFTFICWYLFQPFMGEYFQLRSRLLIYEYAMGTNEIVKGRQEQEAVLKEHQSRFAQLNETDKENIVNDYRRIQRYAQRATMTKLRDGLNALLFAIPPFEMAWIAFSVAAAISLLKRRAGARAAAWLIPLLAAASLCDIILSPSQPYQSPDSLLFPSEHLLIDKFIDPPLSESRFISRTQLEKGWTNYLAQEWSVDGDAREGEFNFTIARLKALQREPISKWTQRHTQKMGLSLACAMLLWSLIFAWVSSRATIDVKALRVGLEFDAKALRR